LNAVFVIDTVFSYGRPLKRRFLQEPHGAISQKTQFFTVTAVKTPNTAKDNLDCLFNCGHSQGHPIGRQKRAKTNVKHVNNLCILS
jgi:hypothetical protein